MTDAGEQVPDLDSLSWPRCAQAPLDAANGKRLIGNSSSVVDYFTVRSGSIPSHSSGAISLKRFDKAARGALISELSVGAPERQTKALESRGSQDRAACIISEIR